MAIKLKTCTIRKGTLLYHGTDGDFDESQGLARGSWVSRFPSVAQRFAFRETAQEGTPHIPYPADHV
jgi:hypothetical protein